MLCMGSTARGSWIGHDFNVKEILAIYDPVTKEEVKLKWYQ